MKKGLVVILSGACSVGKHDLTNRLLNDPDLMDGIMEHLKIRWNF